MKITSPNLTVAISNAIFPMFQIHHEGRTTVGPIHSVENMHYTTLSSVATSHQSHLHTVKSASTQTPSIEDFIV